MGLLDPPSLTLGTAETKFGFLQGRRPALKGVPIATGFRATGVSAAQATAQTTVVTAKFSGIVGFDASDLRMVIMNWRTNMYNEGTKPYEDVDSEVAFTGIRAGIVLNNITYALTLNGRRDITIDPGGWIETDPLPQDVVAGQIIRSVIYIPAGSWRVLAAIQNPALAGDGAGVTVSGDFTADGATQLADGGGSGPMPAAITGTPKNKRQRTVFISGASDGEGVGDGMLQNAFNMGITQQRHGRWGFINRALVGNTGVIQTARSGDRADKFILPQGHRRRLLFASSCSDVVTTYGLNDINTGFATLAQLQVSKLAEWQLYSKRGCRVWQTTLTPWTTSTDFWATLANQTVLGTEAVRTGFNNWVRDGAPINYPAMTAAAVGAVGAGVIRAGIYVGGVFNRGDSRHPLYGHFEVADKAESARNSGKWRVDGIETRADLSATVGSNNYSTPGRAWTTADLWKLVIINGTLRGYVATVAGNNFTLLTTSGTAVNAGATGIYPIAIGVPTVDGAHGTADMHLQMQTAIDTTLLLGD